MVTLVPLAVVGSVLGIVQGAFGTPIRGSLALFYVVTVVYVFAMASLGLGIAVVARTLGQAMSHYVDFGYQLLFKGNGWAYVWPDVAGILALGVALFLLSVRRFARLVR